MATINICDVCKASENVNRLYYCYDRQPDGAGGSEDVGETYDLCQPHELVALKRAIKKSYKADIKDYYEFNQLIIAEIKGMIKQRS